MTPEQFEANQEAQLRTYRARVSQGRQLFGKEETNMGNSLKLSEARQATPAVSGVGAWAEKLRKAAFDAVSTEDMTALMQGLLKKAQAGDLAAAKLVLTYLTGGGAPQVQVTKVIERTIVKRQKPKRVVMEPTANGNGA